MSSFIIFIYPSEGDKMFHCRNVFEDKLGPAPSGGVIWPSKILKDFQLQNTSIPGSFIQDYEPVCFLKQSSEEKML